MPGSFFYVSNFDEKKFPNETQYKTAFEKHEKAILANNVRYKIIIKEGDYFRPAIKYAEYRWAKEDRFDSLPIYIYGDKVAMIAFGEGADINVFVIQHQIISELCKKQFNEIWNRTIEIPSQK